MELWGVVVKQRESSRIMEGSLRESEVFFRGQRRVMKSFLKRLQEFYRVLLGGLWSEMESFGGGVVGSTTREFLGVVLVNSPWECHGGSGFFSVQFCPGL